MKTKALALTLISWLSILTVAFQFFSVTSANFIGALILPNEPHTTPPAIVVHSPVQNETCNSTNVWLNFTVTKPKGFFGNVTSVWYTVDGGERQNIEVHDRFVNDSDSIFLPVRELNFSSNLKLTVGAHNVKVSLEAQSYYIDYVDRQGWIFPSILVHAETETVTFTVEETPFQELTSTAEFNPFPTTLVTATVAIVAVFGFGFLINLAKRKQV